MAVIKYFNTAAASQYPTVLRTGPTRVLQVIPISSAGTNTRFVKFCDQSTTPAGTEVPLLTVTVMPVLTTQAPVTFPPGGVYFEKGLAAYSSDVASGPGAGGGAVNPKEADCLIIIADM